MQSSESGGTLTRNGVLLNTALKGAATLTQLLQAFDAHRGHGNRRVSVGNVNVESSGQAIVGNVETPTPQSEPTTEAGTVEPKRKARAA
jgi:hypothetical protein